MTNKDIVLRDTSRPRKSQNRTFVLRGARILTPCINHPDLRSSRSFAICKIRFAIVARLWENFFILVENTIAKRISKSTYMCIRIYICMYTYIFIHIYIYRQTFSIVRGESFSRFFLTSYRLIRLDGCTR